MFAFPLAKRPLRLAASLIFCLAIATAAMPAAAADSQGYLGVRLQELTPSMAKALQLGDRAGVLVNEVVADSPAEKAGLLDGDVILEVDGKSVSGHAALTGAVRQLEPGRKARLLVLRDGKQKDFDVEIGKRDTKMEWLAASGAPEAPDAPDAPDLEKLRGLKGLEKLKKLEGLKWFDGENGKVMVLPHGDGESREIDFHGQGDGDDDSQHRIVIRTIDDDRGWLGVHLDALNGQLGEYFGVKDGAGVLVSEVVADSPAAKSGLKAGDVIVKVAGKKVDSPDALHEAMSGTKPGDDLDLQVLRKGDSKTVTAKLGDMPQDAGRTRIEFMGKGEPGEMKMMAPRMLQRMGRAGGGDDGEEREIIIDRKRRSRRPDERGPRGDGSPAAGAQGTARGAQALAGPTDRRPAGPRSRRRGGRATGDPFSSWGSPDFISRGTGVRRFRGGGRRPPIPDR